MDRQAKLRLLAHPTCLPPCLPTTRLLRDCGVSRSSRPRDLGSDKVGVTHASAHRNREPGTRLGHGRLRGRTRPLETEAIRGERTQVSSRDLVGAVEVTAVRQEPVGAGDRLPNASVAEAPLPDGRRSVASAPCPTMAPTATSSTDWLTRAFGARGRSGRAERAQGSGIEMLTLPAAAWLISGA